MAKLITPSILDSYSWFKKCPSSWKAKAMKDFMNQLNRIWEDFPEDHPIKVGIKFEKQVQKYCQQNITDKGSDLFKEYVDKVRGATFQKKTKRFIEVDGVEYILYGKIDADFKDTIIDMKVTGKYKGKSQFLDKSQHRIYCFNERKKKFIYLVAEMDYKTMKIIDIHEVEYFVDDEEDLKQSIVDDIREFITFINADPLMKEAYYNTFNMYS